MPYCAHEHCGRWRPLWLAPRALTFDGAWFCRPACLRDDATVRLQALEPERPLPAPPVRFRLGTLLLAERAVTPEVLQQALERQARSGLRLGAELLAMGAVDAATLTRALASQAGIGYLAALSPRHVGRVTADLSPSAVVTLGVVPFEQDQQRVLRVAVAAPVPRAALRTLQRMTGLEVRPYLVPDATLEALLAAYGGEAPRRRGALTSSAGAAAERVADAARRGEADAWRCVPAWSFTWVRLQGTGGTDDIIITSSREEDAWQAASTRH